MFELSIIDVSALVYTGVTSSFYREKSFYGYPVGGIHYLLKYLTLTLKSFDEAILVFDSKSNFRKKLDSSYKEGRVPNKTVISQTELIYEGLLECGFKCYRFDGYEGDDVINWAVQQNLNGFNLIRIYGNDRDLLHNVQNKVSFKPIREGMNYVDITNFAHAIYKDVSIMFNTINAYKVFCGCPSDNVKPFVSEDGKTGMLLYQTYLQVFDACKIPKTYEYTSSKIVLRNFLNSYKGITDNDRRELLKRIDIIYPADCPEGVVISSSSLDNINKEAFQHFMCMYNAYDALRCLEMRKIDISKTDIEFLKNQAYKLNSGEFCVDHSIPVNVDMPDSEDLFLKEF